MRRIWNWKIILRMTSRMSCKASNGFLESRDQVWTSGQRISSTTQATDSSRLELLHRAVSMSVYSTLPKFSTASKLIILSFCSSMATKVSAPHLSQLFEFGDLLADRWPQVAIHVIITIKVSAFYPEPMSDEFWNAGPWYGGILKAERTVTYTSSSRGLSQQLRYWNFGSHQSCPYSS